MDKDDKKLRLKEKLKEVCDLHSIAMEAGNHGLESLVQSEESPKVTKKEQETLAKTKKTKRKPAKKSKKDVDDDSCTIC